jgi:O-antigen ligase
MRWLSRAALSIALIVVMARGLALETVRATPPASADAPAEFGPGAVVILDWLAFVPALLVLLRRVIDRSYTLRFTLAHGMLALIAILAGASTLWAGDKYLALVSAGQLIAAAALCWAFSQIVRNWQHLRIVAAVCVGLLAAYAVNGFIYREVELRDTIAAYEKDYATILQAVGVREPVDPARPREEKPYDQQQFEARLYSGALMGYTTSSNGFASIVTLLAIVSVGCVAQRYVDTRGERSPDQAELGWAAVPGVIALLSIYLLAFTGSKASWVALPLGVGALFAWWPLRERLKKHHGLAFGIACALVAMGVVALIALGLQRGGLPEDSLNFRWRYWVGSVGVFLDHPLLGVGWANFGDPYLAHRLVDAVEGIKDPHNFVVRLFVELGLLGGLLGLAWVVSLAWALTRPTPADAPTYVPKPSIQVMHLLPLPLGATAIFLVVHLSGPTINEMELIRRVLYAGVMALALGTVPILSKSQPVTDDRPAGFIHGAMVVAIGMLLLTSLIDMTLFMTGPLMIVAMVSGAALGVRLHLRPIGARGQVVSIVALTLLLLVWIVGLILTVVPVTNAGNLADKAMREFASRNVNTASDLMGRAARSLPIANADYEEMHATYLAYRPNGFAEALEAIGRAVEANPTSPRLWAQRARFRLRSGDASLVPGAIDDLKRAVELAPSEMDLRQELAEAFAGVGRRAEAAEQIEAVLGINDRLDPNEPKRLSTEQVDVLRTRAAQLRAGTR